MPLFLFRYCTILLVVAFSIPGHAETTSAGQSADEEIEDEVLHSCAKVRGLVRVSLRPSASLDDLVGWAMSFSCKNFIYTTDLAKRSSKVEILAPSQLSAKQSYHLFEVALQSLGLTVIRKGKLLHIVEAAQGSKYALPIRKKSAGGERLERLIVQPDYISLEDTQKALGALASPQGAIVVLPSAGALLVTDYGSHTTRMAELLRQVDQPGANEGLFAIHLRYADVDVVSKQLVGLLDFGESNTPTPRARRGKAKAKAVSAPTSGPPSLIVADARSGTLLIRASSATYLRALRIVHELDRKLESDESSRIHVYPLQNADAEKLAATLNALVVQGSANPAGAGGARVDPKLGSGASISGDLKISADTETNSLLILSNLRDYLATKKLIEGLDKERPQVFLEVTILEVDIANGEDYSGSFHLGKTANGGLVFGGSQQPGTKTGSTAALQSNLQQDGLIVGALGELLNAEEFLGVSIPSFAALFQAIATDERIDILSNPQLMTTNNTKAKLSVGQNVPYKAGSSTAGGGVSDTISREDVEMTLEVTPHVNLGGLVRLEIELNIKELLPTAVSLEPTWTTRKISNTVVVGDQESIAIGGLASTKETMNKSKVPLLGDLPVLGALFRSSQKSKSKSNLLVLLTPYVLTNAADARRLTRRKLHERDVFLHTFKSLRKRAFEPNIDYSRKRGLLSEMDRAVRASEAEARAFEELQQQGQRPVDGPLLEVEPPTAPQ
jgi:general secretion pathway protein D